MQPNDPVTIEALILKYRVEAFLYREAELLDERRHEDWLALFAPDIRYVMPLRTNRARRELHLEYSGEHESAYFDETYDSLAMRIRKFSSGANWAEDPPSRTRHLITNIRVNDLGNGEVEVKSDFIVYRNRLERQTEIFAGERQDLLRADGGGFRIARRRILLDQGTLLTSSLSFFF